MQWVQWVTTPPAPNLLGKRSIWTEEFLQRNGRLHLGCFWGTLPQQHMVQTNYSETSVIQYLHPESDHSFNQWYQKVSLRQIGSVALNSSMSLSHCCGGSILFTNPPKYCGNSWGLITAWDSQTWPRWPLSSEQEWSEVAAAWRHYFRVLQSLQWQLSFIWKR